MYVSWDYWKINVKTDNMAKIVLKDSFFSFCTLNLYVQNALQKYSIGTRFWWGLEEFNIT